EPGRSGRSAARQLPRPAHEGDGAGGRDRRPLQGRGGRDLGDLLDMSLAPAVKVTLGNLAYDTHLADVAVTLALLPGVNRARATLPSSVALSARPGDPGVAELNGGEGAKTVLTGKIEQIARSFQTITVTIADGGAALSRFRPAKTYEQQNAKDI